MNRIKWLLILGILIGPFLAYMGWQDIEKHKKLEKEGKAVPGMIASGEWKSRKGSRTYKFDIVYQPEGGQPITQKFQVKSDFAKTKTDGNSITDETCQVLYLPSNPQEAIVVGGSSDVMILLWVGLGYAVLGLLTTIFLIMKRNG